MYASEAKKSELTVHFEIALIKIDHIADILLKLQIKIGVHLINVELLQLLTLPHSNRIS